MYEYLLGCGILFVIWALLFFLRKNIRKQMLWTGIVNSSLFIVLWILWLVPSWITSVTPAMIPSYWNPKSLFNFGQLSKGLTIEDVLFGFLVGGIVAVLYEYLLQKHVTRKPIYKRHYIALVAYLASFLFLVLFMKTTTTFYPFLIATGIGAAVLAVQRHDLLSHMFVGGMSFMVVYFLGFQLFNLIFSGYVVSTWTLSNISGVLILGIPLEEIIWAFLFGLMWSPFYEYEYGIADRG